MSDMDKLEEDLDRVCRTHGLVDFFFVSIAIDDKSTVSWSSSDDRDGIYHAARHERLLGAIDCAKTRFVNSVIATQDEDSSCS